MNNQNSPPLFMPSDDSLQSEEFHRYFRKNIQYFSAGNRLYVWINDKRCFEYMTKAQAMILIDSLIDPAYEGRVRSSALEETYKKLIRDSTHIRNPDALLNEGQYYLNLRNGVLDLRTLKLLTRKESAEKAESLCFTYQLEFSYVDTATLKDAPAFCGFLDTSLDGASMENPKAVLLLEIIGTSLSSLKMIRKMFFLVGATKSGKSVTVDFLQNMIWPGTAVTVFGINELSGRFNMQHLESSRLNICRELTAAKITGTDTIKKIVSEEPLFVEGKGKEGYVADIHTKLVTCANQMPVFGEMDSAGNKSVTDRMVVLRFNHTIPEEQMDRELPDKLLNERDTICSLAMKALNGLISRGYIFTLPEDSKKLIDSYIQENVSLQLFLEDWCIEDPDGKVHKHDLIARYHEYCQDNALKPYTDKQVSAFIEGRYPDVTRGKFRMNGKYLWGWSGISLKSVGTDFGTLEEENDNE